ncbi:recombining binding protein suppressor of hairless-like protein [Gymnodraco acuticeps]|uniref:Recombining binding protein suppressor of hairless-like protein n=1 Tax=Gymnodraco acuticeps TaxID=8218 RepID=A0A6P8WFK5_GYMAC|nr:recombining binding protein suppressor of hairless-like protein [Gymnodraco acuticeps]
MSEDGPEERLLLMSAETNMEELDIEERKDSPRFSEADSSLLDPASLSPAPDPLSHLGSLLAGGWDRRADQSYQSCQLPGREAHADQSVTILHAKVAQKSYGNEKRFFCPPPCVFISGPGWRVMQNHLKAAGHGDAVYRVCGFLCLDNTSQSQVDAYKLVFNEQPNSRMFASAKSLFISDQDKRKHFCLLLRLFLGNRQEVGSFQSRMIKVISKPSQKRQSMKNADLCISSCSRVALFNRLRSQTVSTRYLSVDRGAFIASAKQWTAFTITLVEDQRNDHGDFVLSEGFICYGCVVQLVCSESGVALPPMVIRKVNKQHAFLNVDEPVSQLHKCAFQFRHDPNAYLCLSNDNIIQHQASPSLTDPLRVGLNDGSCWTIIGVEVVEFTFNQGSSCILTPVTPFPVICGLEVNGGGHVAMLEIYGESFSSHLKVWFGNNEAETMFKSPQSLLCVVPDISVFSDGWRCLRRVLTVPLALIRSDGLIYRTSFSFTYTPEIKPPPSRGTSGGGKREGGTEGGQQEDVLLETIHQEFTRANFHLFMQS